MIELLYHQKGLIACKKEIGVSAQDTATGDGLPQLLSLQLGHPVCPLHRIDQGVGGILLLCDDPKRTGRYTEALQNGKIRKRYLAVLPKAPEEKTGTLSDLLFHDKIKNRTYVVDRMRKGVKTAVLDYTVLQEKEDGQALLCITLQTGRTHQIRAQFSHLGLPLSGDGKYGSRIKGNIALWSYAFDSEEDLFPPLRLLPPQSPPWDGFDLSCLT